MRNPINAKVREIKPSGIRRFFDIANEIPGVISLGVGEPDFDTPWIVRDEGMYTPKADPGTTATFSSWTNRVANSSEVRPNSVMFGKI